MIISFCGCFTPEWCLLILSCLPIASGVKRVRLSLANYLLSFTRARFFKAQKFLPHFSGLSDSFSTYTSLLATNPIQVKASLIMDEETFGLILYLQIVDMRSLAATRKGKAVEGSLATDEESATELQRNELHNQKLVMADILMARSISWVVQDDHRNSGRWGTPLGTRPSNGYSIKWPPVPLDIPDCRADEGILSRFDSLKVCQAEIMFYYIEFVVSFTEQRLARAYPGFWSRDREIKNPAWTRRVLWGSRNDTCIMPTPILQDVTRLITDAIVDESMFPPRCCSQATPLSSIRFYTSANLTAKIQQKVMLE